MLYNQTVTVQHMNFLHCSRYDGDKFEMPMMKTAQLNNQKKKCQDFEGINASGFLMNRLMKLNARRNHKYIQPIISVIVIACNRITIKSCLDDLIKYRSNPVQFPIIVSQDCDHKPTQDVIKSYWNTITFMRQPDQNDIVVPPNHHHLSGYYRIARHYGWSLNMIFNAGFESVIVVEDDLNVSPDFYEYFLGTYQLLENDPTLWCVSAWNDNGMANKIDLSSPELLYRTDFFPGLGWMMTHKIWSELSAKWPKVFWDDWMREPQQRKNRACIRPEIPRTRTFGKIGVSNGQYYDEYLQYIKLNEKKVDFTKINMTYLIKQNYDEHFVRQVYSSPLVEFEEIRSNLVTSKSPVRVQYKNEQEYGYIANILGLMNDFKIGIPRTAYLGIVSLYYNNRRVYLAPPNNNWNVWNSIL